VLLTNALRSLARAGLFFFLEAVGLRGFDEGWRKRGSRDWDKRKIKRKRLLEA
jgi:hypothetical protein